MRTYGQTLATKTIAWIEASLRITQGEGEGEPVKLMTWQKRFLAGALASTVRDRGRRSDDGGPPLLTAALSMARAGGKSTLMAAIACAGIAGPLARPRGEIVVTAGSLQQARIIHEHALAFMQPLIRAEPGRWRVAAAPIPFIEDRKTGSRVRCQASNPATALGGAGLLYLCDEPAAWGKGERDDGEQMFQVIRTSLGKIEGSRALVVGTRPADPGHWFARLCDAAGAGAADYVQVHAADLEADPFSWATWLQANPSLKRMPTLKATIVAEAAAAKVDANLVPSFAAYRLNRGTADHPDQLQVLSAETWKEVEGDAAASGPRVFGVDLGTSMAQSAIACFWPSTGRLEAIAAFPEQPSLRDRGITDAVGDLYLREHERGELITAGVRAVTLAPLLAAALERFGPPALVVSDRWREKELRDALEATGTPPAEWELRGQGFRDGAEDVRGFRAAVLDGRVIPVESLLLRASLLEARVVSDVAGNAKLARAGEGKRSRGRDDAAAAAILAVASGERWQKRRPKRGAHHRRAVLV